MELWAFDIFFMLILMHLFYPQNIFSHQIIPMLFVAIIDLFLLIYASTSKVYDEGKKNIYEYKGKYLCCFAIIIYIDITFLVFYARINTKVLMDDIFISPYKIMFIIGIIGFLLELITSVIFFLIDTNKKCHQYNDINIFCYFNINDYFTKFSNIKHNYLILLKEIFLTIFYVIFESMSLICELFIIKYLNPNYILMSDNVYFEIIKLKKFFLYDKDDKNIFKMNFYIIQLSQIVEFIGCLIYLELIELKFCGLNKNTKRNIIRRSLSELKKINFNNIIDERGDLSSENSINENINEQSASLEIGSVF